MKRITLITSIMLVTASGALAQSDEDMLEAFRTHIADIYLDQMQLTFPELIRNRELAPSDKERLIAQLVDDLTTCHTDAIVEYAASNDIPLSDLISEPSEGITFDRDSGNEYGQLLDPCLLNAMGAAGVLPHG
jgi:hypothetical protein